MQSNLRRLSVFLIVFLALNLSFIPLLAAYGLSVCPVLKVSGFMLGCAYSGVFVGLVYIINLILILIQSRVNFGKVSRFVFPLSYLVATGIALLLLKKFMGISHAGSQSRAPQILILASLLLGVTQYYGLTWCQFGAGKKSKRPLGELWRKHSIRLMLPMLSGLLILLHFVTSQAALGKTDPFVSVDLVSSNIRVVIFFVSTWMLVTYAFHFLTEKDAVLQLSQKVSAIESGDYEERKPFQASGLWLFMFQKLEDLGTTLKERGLLLNSFSKFVAKDVVAKATKDEIKNFQGQEVELTIIMIDIRNFTRISDTLSAEKVIQMLNAYFNLVIDIFTKSGIHIDKFIGDGILAYVEPGKSAVEDNECALTAMDKILNELPKLNKILETEGLPQVSIGAGIHRGFVVRGLIGSNQRLEHTIIGDPVNRTSRLEGLTKEHGVQLVVSKEVYSVSSDVWKKRMRELGAAHVKGIESKLEIYGF